MKKYLETVVEKIKAPLESENAALRERVRDADEVIASFQMLLFKDACEHAESYYAKYTALATVEEPTKEELRKEEKG